jgi:hypothetical protein
MSDRQIRKAELAGMSAEAIVAARKAGRLANILARREPEPDPEAEPEAEPVEQPEAAAQARVGGADQGARGSYQDQTYQINDARLQRMSPEQIVVARRRGQLRRLMGGG